MNERAHEKLRRAIASMDDVAGSGDDCPAAELLWESARGKLELDRNEQVVLHLGECGACAAAWRVSRGMASETPARTRTSWMPVAAAAAVFVVAFGLAAVWKLRTFEPAPVFRTQEQVGIEAGAGTESLPGDRFELTWTAETGATYDLLLTRDDLEVVYRATGLDEPAHHVPAEALEGVPSGARLFWQVTAHRLDGRVLVSDTFVTTLE